MGGRPAQRGVHPGRYWNADLIRENSPLSGAPTASPRSSASWRSSAISASLSLVGRLDDELSAQVAAAATLQAGHAAVAQHELATGLRARRDDQLLVAIEGRQLHGGAERGLGDGDRNVGHEVVALAPVALVSRDPEVDVEIAVGAAAGPAAPRPLSRSVEPLSTPAGTSTW